MHDTGQLTQIVILLAAAVGIVALFRVLRLSPVLGYLVAGAAIGPYGMGIIEHIETTSAIAEYGVVFLLFLIGLELSLDRLRAMRTHVFGFGTLQMAITSVIVGLVASLLGAPVEVAIIIGGGLALSSTAIVLQVVAESGGQSSQVGRLSLAILLLQDLAVVPLLVLVPLLAGDHVSLPSVLTSAALRAAVALVVIFVVGRLVIRPLFRVVASLHSTELFAATTLLVVLGFSWITEQSGLSLALGAFMAGLLVAETEYQHQVEADILPYKELFLGLFFMTVGMSVDSELLMDKWIQIFGIAIALMSCKALIIFSLCRLFRFSRPVAIQTGLLVSQGSEFAFVLFGLAAVSGVITLDLSQILLVAVTVSMALTPLVALAGKKLSTRLERRKSPSPQRLPDELKDLENHIVIAGFGRMGQLVARLLTAEKINFIALDVNPIDVAMGRKRGKPVYYGDASRLDVLEAVGIRRAKTAVVTFHDGRTAEKTIRTLRAAFPHLPIITRAHDTGVAQILREAGANVAVPEVFEGSLQVGGALLRSLGINEHEITRIIDIFRANSYEMTKSDDVE